MNSPASNENEGWKGRIGMPWGDRKEVQRRRDNKLIQETNGWGIMTVELACALLDLPKTLSNMRILDRRFDRLTQTDFNRVLYDGIPYFFPVTTSQAKAEKAQIGNRFMEVWFLSTWIRAVRVQRYLMGAQLWAKERLYTPEIVPDSVIDLNGADTLFPEYETGKSHYDKILPRCWKYYRARDALKREYGAKEFKVMWNCKDPAWPQRIITDIRAQMPEEAWSLFLAVAEKDIDPFRPDSVLDDPIYIAAFDNQKHGFIE